jgi:peptide subunit release factor 1 (eRF1)
MTESPLMDRLDTLAHLEPAFPLLSLYLNTEADGTGHHPYHVFLRKELRERVKIYAESPATTASLDRDIARIEEYVAKELKPSTRGLALFASANTDLFEAIQFDVPFERNQLRVGDRPHLYPLARLDDQYPRCAALVADTNTARIFVFSTGRTVRAEEIQNAKTKHFKAGGWSQARLQRHVDNLRLQHTKEVAIRLDEIVAGQRIDHVVIAGDEVIVPLLTEQMPTRLAGKIVDVVRLDIRSPEHEVLAATLDALRQKDGETDETVVRDLVGESRAGGRAVVEPQHVLAALRKGQVDTLVITAAPEQLAGADEVANQLVTLAKQTSASVRFVENPALLADVGGVGASLRYVA